MCDFSEREMVRSGTKGNWERAKELLYHRNDIFSAPQRKCRLTSVTLSTHICGTIVSRLWHYRLTFVAQQNCLRQDDKSLGEENILPTQKTVACVADGVFCVADRWARRHVGTNYARENSDLRSCLRVQRYGNIKRCAKIRLLLYYARILGNYAATTLL